MTIKVKLVTKPMKTADLESGQHGNPKAVAADVTDVTPKPPKGKAMNHPDHAKKPHLTPEELAAGKTPNSGKLKKDGTPVPGQDAAHDAERAAERAAEAAAGSDVPDPTPEPTPPPVV